MNLVDVEAYANMDGVTLRCYPGESITTVVMKNTNSYAVYVDFINGTVPSRMLLTEDESQKFQFALVQCSPTLVVIKKVTKA
ncbi:hypothetical protein [uncultured Stenotrophomonas sp.]|nr:hypothetical protein [uncultured Stenotrophomonas sp.]